jgi:hypothetical protein
MHQHALDAILESYQAVLLDVVWTSLEACCPFSVFTVVCVALHEPIGIEMFAARRKARLVQRHLERHHHSEE